MAELAGSIIGIISAGTKVALVLSQLASDLGSAGQEARMISSEIRSFCTILNALKDAMEKVQSSSYFAHCADMMQTMTDASIEMFTEVLDAVETLRGMASAKDKEGKFRLLSKLQWVVFQKPKIVVLRAALEAYKSNIALMLGTINIVEKVARRSSFPQVRATTAEDDQEQTTLQSLELDCRSSMISLEEAEIRYKSDLLQTLPGEDTTFENFPLNLIRKSEIVEGDETFNEMNGQRRNELYMARVEVASIRCSLLARNSEEVESLQAQMVRHSQSLSKLLEADRWRLSQRWSTSTSSDIDDTISASNIGVSVFDAAQNSLTQDTRHSDLSFMGFGQETVYMNFRTWLLGQPWSDQDKILEKLREDVLSDRLPGDYGAPRRLSTDNVPAPRLLEAMPIVQGRIVPSTPRMITIRNANDPVISIASSSHGATDHKRSRSDSILANGTFIGRQMAMRRRDETFFRLTGTRPSDAEQ